ncbi:phosphatase PAP2 family protein [uncultured Cohaesibacter sp.]|uniref:phosphatase PAP2 family protein n=1 Tax=uncultured Cohaesibacter sp. TaxID=1002546 RepID=UPI002931A43C|nr:phosphatase PAP2 family protein [uncultured Cohaesibacter sp.]
MLSNTVLKQSANEAKRQYEAFKALLAHRSGAHKAYGDLNSVTEPEWKKLLFVALSLIVLSFLFFDTMAGHWQPLLPEWLYSIFRTISRFGKSDYTLIPSGLLVIVIAFLPPGATRYAVRSILYRFQMLGLFIFVAIAGSGLLNNLIKVMFGRARPKFFGELGPYFFDPPGINHGYQSFPSGHSATAGAMAIIMVLLFPKQKRLWLFLAGMIAFSRIMVGAHYPSDTVAGFAFGAGVTWLFAKWCVHRRLLFRVQDGLIRLPTNSGLSLTSVYKALHLFRRTA